MGAATSRVSCTVPAVRSRVSIDFRKGKAREPRTTVASAIRLTLSRGAEETTIGAPFEDWPGSGRNGSCPIRTGRWVVQRVVEAI
jgi:hypothetical protein